MWNGCLRLFVDEIRSNPGRGTLCKGCSIQWGAGHLDGFHSRRGSAFVAAGARAALVAAAARKEAEAGAVFAEGRAASKTMRLWNFHEASHKWLDMNLKRASIKIKVKTAAQVGSRPFASQPPLLLPEAIPLIPLWLI